MDYPLTAARQLLCTCHVSTGVFASFSPLFRRFHLLWTSLWGLGTFLKRLRHRRTFNLRLYHLFNIFLQLHNTVTKINIVRTTFGRWGRNNIFTRFNVKIPKLIHVWTRLRPSPQSHWSHLLCSFPGELLQLQHDFSTTNSNTHSTTFPVDYRVDLRQKIHPQYCRHTSTQHHKVQLQLQLLETHHCRCNTTNSHLLAICKSHKLNSTLAHRLQCKFLRSFKWHKVISSTGVNHKQQLFIA